MSAVPATPADAARAVVFRQFPFGTALPEPLTSWLAQHQPHAVFATPEWFEQLAAFKHQLGAQAEHAKYRECCWFVMYRGEAPVLAAPMERRGSLARRAEWRLLANFYTPAVGLFVDPAQVSPEQAWPCLLQALDHFEPGWTTLQAAPLTAPQHALLQAAAAEKRCTTFAQLNSVNHTVEIASLPDYWQARPSRLRNTLKRKHKQLAKVTHRFELSGHPDAAQVAGYWQVYQASWKPQEPSRCFINWLIDWSARHGYLRLGLLYVDERPVASQIWLVVGDKAHIFKLAQDPVADPYSPGSMLTEYMLNTLYETDRVRHIDFLLGDNAFKSLWMDCSSPVFITEVVNSKRPAGMALAVLYRCRHGLRSMPGAAAVRAWRARVRNSRAASK